MNKEEKHIKRPVYDKETIDIILNAIKESEE